MTMRAQAQPDGSIAITDTATPATGPNPQANAHDPQRRAFNMTGTVTTGPNGEAIVHPPTRTVHAHDVLPNEGILDSATRNGFRIGRGGVTDTDVVTIPALGGSLRVREAVTLGYLRPVQGGFEEVAPPVAVEEQHQGDQEHQDAPEDTVRLPQDSEDILTHASAQLGRDTMVNITYALVNGKDVESYLPDIGRALGLDKADAQERIAAIHGQLLAQGQDAAASVGLDLDQWGGFVEWAQTARKGQRQAAMLDLAEYGNTAGVKKLVKEYLQSTQGGNRWSEAEVLAADFGPGVSVRRGSDGKLVVTLPDGEMRFDQAVAQGRITVSKKR